MHDDGVVVGNRLKKLRAERAMTQEDVAARAGLGLATIQRAERGARVSAGTLASLAAAFALDATELSATLEDGDERPYLPLAVIETGRGLVAILGVSSRVDFAFAEIDDLARAELIERLHAFFHPSGAERVPTGPVARVKLELTATQLIKELAAAQLVVTGATFELRCHEIDDDCGAGQPILMASWEEVCAVVRVGTDGEPVGRAYVMDGLGKWETPIGDDVVFPPTPKPEEFLEKTIGPAEQRDAGRPAIG